MRSLVGDRCWSVCRKSGILFCTNAYITRCAARSSTVRWRRKAVCRRRGTAGELGVSRNTILTTYEQLLAEGYVVSRRGSGTFVAQTAPESSLTAKGQQENSSIAAPTAHLSRRGQHLLGVSASPRQWGAFIPGVPDVNAFPHPLFSKIQPASAVGPNRSGSAIAATAAPRNCSRRWWIICACRAASTVSQIKFLSPRDPPAIDLVTRMLCDNGDLAWVEEPSYWGSATCWR